MEQPIRNIVMDFLNRQTGPVTRAQVAAACPERHVNSVNRMLRDMVKRGTVVETCDGFALAPLSVRRAVASVRPEEEK